MRKEAFAATAAGRLGRMALAAWLFFFAVGALAQTATGGEAARPRVGLAVLRYF